MRRLFLALGGVLALLVSSCGSTGDHHSTAPATGTLPPPAATSDPAATTTTIPDTSVVPAMITVAYVDAVLGKLDEVFGNALRTAAASHALTPQAALDLRAIFTAQQFQVEVRIIGRTVSLKQSGLQTPPGDQVITVEHIVSATPSCIFLTARTNFSAVDVTTVPILHVLDYYMLTRKRPNGDPQHINSTPWVIAGSLMTSDSETVPDRCHTA